VKLTVSIEIYRSFTAVGERSAGARRLCVAKHGMRPHCANANAPQALCRALAPFKSSAFATLQLPHTRH
jgi:hypothetical protein